MVFLFVSTGYSDHPSSGIVCANFTMRQLITSHSYSVCTCKWWMCRAKFVFPLPSTPTYSVLNLFEQTMYVCMLLRRFENVQYKMPLPKDGVYTTKVDMYDTKLILESTG